MKILKPLRTSILIMLMLASFFATGQQLETSVFVTANTGTTDNNSVLSKISDEAKTLANSKLLILGNIVSKEGYSEDTKAGVESQLKTLKAFKGDVVFAPGHHEWANYGHRGDRKSVV